MPDALAKKLLASVAELAWYQYAPPWVAFVPLFSCTFTDAPPAKPCSASLALVATFTFWMASIEGTTDWALVLQKFSAFTPSILTVLALVPVPLNEKVIDLEGLLVPPVSCPAGGVVPGTNS